MTLTGTLDWPQWSVANPFRELDQIHSRISNLLGRMPDVWQSKAQAGVFPLLNVTEDKDNYYLRAELPGIKPDDLDISVIGDTIAITGERKVENIPEKAKYHRRERDAGKFRRALKIPVGIDADKVEARSVNGILTVVVPKAEQTKPKQITVRAA